MKNFKKILKEKVALLERVYPFASFFLQSKSSMSATSSTRNDSLNFDIKSTGGVVRVFDGVSFHERAFSSVSEKEIEEATKFLLQLSSKIEIIDNTLISPGEKTDKEFSHKWKIDPMEVDEQTLLNKARENREYVEGKSEKIVEASCRIGFLITQELYINRNKTLFQELRRFDNIFSIVLQENGKSVDMFGGHSRIGGYEHAQLEESTVNNSVKDGEDLLLAKRIDPGSYDCILSPSMSGMLAHEAFGHGTETDMFLKKRAKGVEFIGKRVGAECVNMWDSPDMNDEPNASGSYFFDHEGELASKTQIIKEGVLVSGITDLYSSSKLGIKRSANGRSESYANKVYARMTNTYFEGGDSTLDEMIASIKHGFFIDHATNGMEDPKGWGMQLEALYAREIIDGKFTNNIYSPVILTGYVPDVLNSISAMSKGHEIHSMGYCGKGHKEWVKVTDGGPYIKLKANLA